ncbi:MULTISPECIES: hypothetical protein [unclassified Marinovum]|uniref:hypothetical protein n=1 Tax=unclassified Marinovum TaxID=2647166 RepID=UPI003EDC48B9
MAKTSTERMREKKERDRREHFVSSDSTGPYLEKKFSELWDQHAGFSNFEMSLELAGIEPPRFEDERNPEDEIKNAEAIGLELYGTEAIYGNHKGAIGRAEIIVGCLLDAALELADIVNTYKRQEIEARIAELEKSDAADRATAIQEAVKLNKILDKLDKQVRRNFPQWKVTDV